MKFKRSKHLLKMTVLATAFGTSIPLYAATTETPDTSDDWQFTVAPYLWALNMDGNVQIGKTKARMSENFGDIWDQLQWAGMIYLEAHKDKFGLFFNAIYSVLNQSGDYQTNLKTKFGLFTGGVSYDWLNKSLGEFNEITLSPYLGFRTTVNNLTLTAPGLSVSNDHTWTDPILGSKLNWQFTQRWSVVLAADVGGTDSNDYSYNVQGLIGFTPERLKALSVYLGYRYLDEYYVTGSGRNLFSWQMHMHGPLVGLAYTF